MRIAASASCGDRSWFSLPSSNADDDGDDEDLGMFFADGLLEGDNGGVHLGTTVREPKLCLCCCCCCCW